MESAAFPEETMQNFSNLVKASRSYRRFDEKSPVSAQQLYEIAALLRNVPSGTNKQALKAVPVSTPERRDKVFPLLSWAAMLHTWNGPRKGERPTAYIVLACDTAIAKPEGRQTDLGIAAQTMALAAASAGLGACMMGAFSKADMREALELPHNLEPMLVLALGKPAEKVVLVDMGPGGNTSYYRDKYGTHFVPKRPLHELVLKEE